MPMKHCFTRVTALGLLGLSLSLGTLILSTQAEAIETKAREAFVMDFETGAVLMNKNADALMPPASMSKLMTMYLLFERLKDGRLTLDDKLRVSENAWRRGGAKSGGSTMFLDPNSQVTVKDLILGIIVQSGNDACIVVAEALAGTEENFALEMTDKARSFGMDSTTFKNATGWPHPEHRTTARDLALLAQRLITDFPEYYQFYQETTFTHNGIRQSNRNPLLYKDMGADGLKTGHTREAGYGLTASAKRGDRRLIAVLNGMASTRERSSESERLLEWGFREFENYKLFAAGETVETADVWLGEAPTVDLVIQQDVLTTLPRTARRDMTVKVIYEGPLEAPVTKGDPVANVMITTPGAEPIVMPLVAATDVPQLGFMGRIGAALSNILWGSS